MNKFLLQILVFNLLYFSYSTIIPYNYPPLSVYNCDLESSKQIFNYFHGYIFPYVRETYGGRDVGDIISNTCPLHLSNYIFKDLETFKRMNSQDEWECNSCSKKFVNEYFLEKHLINKHLELFSPDAHCPSEVEPLMGCISYENCLLKKCNSNFVETNKKLCYSLADSCFVNEIYIEGFKSEFCDHMKCQNGVFKGLYSKDLVHKSSPPSVLKYIVVIILFTGIVLLCLTTNLRIFFTSRSYKPSVLNRYKKKKSTKLFPFNFFDRKND